MQSIDFRVNSEHASITNPTKSQRKNVLAPRSHRNFALTTRQSVDGVLIDIATPAEWEDNFVDRRGAKHHSLNCMAICDANMKVMYLNCNNPGRVHDSNVFEHSAFARALQDHAPLLPGAVYLADSGYGCSEHIVTPIRGNHLNNADELEYNRSHKRTRVRIEQCFGLAKERFRILKFVNYNPDVAAQIVRCGFILHNIALRYGILICINFARFAPLDELPSVDDSLRNDADGQMNVGPQNQTRRREIIAQFAALRAQGFFD